jgi:hypothetical protein
VIDGVHILFHFNTATFNQQEVLYQGINFVYIVVNYIQHLYVLRLTHVSVVFRP